MVRPAPPGGAALRAGSRPAFLFLAGLVVFALIVMYCARPPVSIAACVLAVPAGVFGAVRLSRTGTRDRLALLALGAALGLLVGGVQSYAGEEGRARSFTAVPLSRAGRFRLSLTADSVLAKNGVRMYSGTLREAAAKGGDLRASAAGSVCVFAPDGPALFWGETIEVEGGIQDSREPGGARFVINARGRSVSPLGFGHPLLAARAAAVEAFLARTAELGAPASSLFEALFLGIKDNLEFELRDAFARTGSLHLLALSGLNVGMIAALILFFLAPLRPKKAKAALAFALVGIYFFIAGPEPSLLRAVLMLGLGTVGLLFDRPVDPLHVLFASAAVVLFVDPESVRSLSFQLSYLALFGILTLGRRLSDRLVPYLPGFARGLVAASLSAQAFTAPLLLAVYGVVYPAGLVVSLLLVPLTTAYLWSGAGFLVLSLIPLEPLRELIRTLMGLQYGLIFGISDFFKDGPALALSWQDWYWVPALVLCLALAVGLPVKRTHELRIAR
jgi:ComEC/Rec2-related protein